MGGAWVFPGGAVDAGETHRDAGVREVAEEAAVALPIRRRWSRSRAGSPAGRSHPVRHAVLPRAAPASAAPRVDGSECVDLGWFAPRAALDSGISLMFPTRRTLEQLADLPSADAALAWAARREPELFTP